LECHFIKPLKLKYGYITHFLNDYGKKLILFGFQGIVMPAVYLGRQSMKWCMGCNLPILEEDCCPACGNPLSTVKHSPPWDIRPAFKGDLDRIRLAADRQFGDGCGGLLVPDGKTVVLNRCPSDDRMDEIIADGQVLGTLRFLVPDGIWVISPRMEGARRMAPKVVRGWVGCDRDAVVFVVDGKSLLAPGVSKAHEDVKAGHEVIVLDPEKKAIAVGLARMDGPEMVSSDHGVSVKCRWRDAPGDANPLPGENTWDEVVEANRPVIERRVKEAVEFIHRTIDDHSDLPVAVSYSGGKDSLATLLLTQDADVESSMLFIDTGIEFEDTLKNVERVARETGSVLHTGKAGEAFWDALETFGHQARDFRWCCKTCKLGPVSTLIRERFPQGVLSFIGQRTYESVQRSKKGRVWENPWVPGQIGASPIQYWTSLHVWLYLFMKKASYNPWYDRGLERIGCIPCPASNLGDLAIIREHGNDLDRWDGYIYKYARDKNYSREYLDYGIWRWKRPPPVFGDIDFCQGEPVETDQTRVHFEEEAKRSGNIFQLEGRISGDIPWERLVQSLLPLGTITEDEDTLNVGDRHLVFKNGRVLIRVNGRGKLRKAKREINDALNRAARCVGCGICAARCPTGAVEIRDGRAWTDPARCNHCGRCLGPCPACAYDSSGVF